MKRIEKNWRDYSRRVMPKDAGLTQIRETRRAFYAGANALFGEILRMLEPGEEATEDDLAKMDEIVDEFNEFAEMVKQGAA